MGVTADELWEITARTIAISGGATLLAALLAIPLGVALARTRRRGRRATIAIVYAGMGLPTVLVGLVLTLLFWREGPLGALDLLYTPFAIALGELVIALPIVAALTISAVEGLEPRVRRQIEALAPTRAQALALLAREARRGILVAVLAGFGHAVSEVGAAMMLGGNLAQSTRVLTTATVLAARMGEFSVAIGLAALLLAISVVVNGAAVVLSDAGKERG